MEVFLKNILRQGFVIMSAFGLLFGLAYATDFFTLLAVSSDTSDPVFSREILAYELQENGTVAYDYIAGRLPERLHLSEVIEKRTESSFTKYIGTNHAGEGIFELVAYPDKTFIERDGEWFARETGHTTYANLATVRSADPIASLFWERAYATTISPFAGAGDGEIEFQDIFGTWASVHDAATGDTANSTGTTFRVSAANLVSIAAGFEIVRGFLPFDTSSIPAAATISSASLNGYVTSKSNSDNDGSDFITVVRTTQATHSTLATADYDATGTTEGIDSGQRKDITGVSTSAYLSFTLNSTGLGWIAKSGEASNCSATTGITCLGLREGHDLLNDSIVGGAANTNRVTFSTSEETGTSQDPYLSVTYTAPGGTSSLSKPPNNLGLVAYWSFNEATSTVATDFSGNGNHGTLENFDVPFSATSGWVNGKRASGLSFAGGTSNDSVNVGSLSALNGATRATISVWVYDRSGAASKSIISRFNGGSPSFILYTSDAGNGGGSSISFSPDGSENVFTTGSVHQTNRWEHWVAVFDGTQGADLDKVTLYLNGVVQAEDITSTPLASAIDTSSDTVRIGADSDLCCEFNGVLDEVRVYNRALGPTEVVSLFGVGGGATRIGASSKKIQEGTTLSSGLVGHWTFDGTDTRWTSPTAGVVYDVSGNNNIGTLTNMTRASDVAIGKLGQALHFDEINNFISIPNHATLNFGTSQNFSVAAWVKARPIAGSYAAIAGKKLSRATNRLGYLLSVQGVLSAYVSDGVDEVNIFSDTSLDDDTWHHVVLTANRTGNATLYVDGLVDGTPAGMSAVGDIDDVAAPLTIGDIGFEGQPFNGSIDDVRIYNRQLSASEVKLLYTLGQLLIRQ